MIFSVKRFETILNNGILDKHKVMMNSVSEFTSVNNDASWSTNQDSFIKLMKTNIVYSNFNWIDNHRKKDNAKLEIDLLILDIDNNLTLDEVYDMVPFKIFTLTTTSHTISKNKFRVFIPLEKKITLSCPKHYTYLLKNINEQYFKNYCDEACFEVGRGFITTKNAESRFNNKPLFDIKIPLWEAKCDVDIDNLLHKKKLIKKLQSGKKINKKTFTISQVLNFPKSKEIISSLGKGNNYRPVFRLMGIGKKSGLTDSQIVDMIMSLNIGNEYSDEYSLLRKVEKYK